MKNLEIINNPRESKITNQLKDLVNAARTYAIASRAIRETLGATENLHGTYIDDVVPILVSFMGIGTIGWVVVKDWITQRFKDSAEDREDAEKQSGE